MTSSAHASARGSTEASGEHTPDNRVKEAMDNMYRYTRHVYDASRKFYLLGRDRLIRDLDAKPDEHICEVGCGTGRNLVLMAQKYPDAHFYGIDASDEMLKSATAKVSKSGINILLAQGYAQNFSPKDIFEFEGTFDKIVFSYSLSMIPPWQESIDHALTLLKPGGTIHVVDFGGQEDMPIWFSKILFKWLDRFGVHYRPELPAYFEKLDNDGAGRAYINRLYSGYSILMRFDKK